MGDLRLSQISLDVLNADETDPVFRLSQISADVLRTPTAATEVWFSAMSLDVLRAPTPPTGKFVAIVNGTDHTADQQIIRSTLVIVDELNQTPNTCDFVTRDTLFTVGTRVEFYLDAAEPSTRLFAGTVITVRQVRKHLSLTGYYDVHCLSDEWLFDRRLVLGRFPEESLTDLATLLIDDIGGLEGAEFTGGHIQPGLPVIQGGYEAIWRRPSEVFTELATLVGGYWYLEDKDLHLFTAEEFGPQPMALTTGNGDYQDFEYIVDLSQVRTLVTVEGKSSNCPNTVAIGQTSIQVDDGSIFSPSGGFARIGPNAFTYEGVTSTGTDPDIVWTLTGIPAINNPSGGQLAIVVPLEANLPVVTYFQATDDAAVSALIALEGGTGLHEHLIQDDSLNVDALQGRAEAELRAFGAPIISIRYKTRDLATRSGRTVRVTLPAPYNLHEEPFIIQRVTIKDFDKVDMRGDTIFKYPPRYVEASPARLTTLVDLLASSEAAGR